MAIHFKILKEQRLMVAVVSGRLDAEMAKATVRRVAADPGFVWNLDRVVFVEDDADLSELDLSGMLAVKDEIIRSYFGGRDPAPAERPAYRMAFVCRQPGNAALMKLFGSIWSTDPSPLVEARLFDSAAGALAWLGHEVVSETELRALTRAA